MALRNVTLAVFAATGAVMAACGHDQETAALTPGFGLFYNDLGATVALAYGKANTDDVGLMLQCVKGSGRVELTDVVRKTPAPTIVLTAAGGRSELPVKLQVSESDSPLILTAQTSLQDAALAGFRKSGRIHVSFGKTAYGLNATPSERGGVERFFAACRSV